VVRHHPSSNMLLAHAAGTQNWSLSISIAAHLQMCTLCRQRAYDLNDIGGALLESVPEEKPSPEAFRRLMGKIEQLSDNRAPDSTKVNTQVVSGGGDEHATSNGKRNTGSTRCSKDLLAAPLPKVLRKLLPRDGQLAWKTVAPSVRITRVDIGQSVDEIAFYHMDAGGKVANHGHGGLEITLVLSGNFSDAAGLYSPGDFVVKDAGEIHRPTATQDQACLYLSVAQAPMVHRTWQGWLGKSLRSLN
jgi:putative transcriptional regulator